MAIKKNKPTPGLSYDSATAATQGLDREQIATRAQSSAAPVPNEPVRRYTKQAEMNTGNPDVALATMPSKTSAAYARKAASVYSTPSMARPTLGQVDEDAIREATRQRMQSSVDAINAQYVNLISQEKVQGEERSGQTRAVNARSGLVGADFGMAHQEKTTQYNKGQEKALADEQNMKVQGVLQSIEQRASEEISRKKQESLQQYQIDLGDYNAKQEQAQKVRDEARADLATLAKSRLDLNQLDPNQKAALFKQAGYDPQFGELIYNANKPKPEQIDYKFEKLADGRGMFYGVDPLTGELKRIDVSVDLPPNWEMTIAPDGTVIGFDKNSGQAQLLSEQGAYIKPNDPLDDVLKQAQIDKLKADIKNGQGGEILSVSDAAALGVPYGTTKEQARGIMIQPKLSAEAQKLMSNVQSGQRALATIKNELFGQGSDGKGIDDLSNVKSNIIFRSGMGMAREYASATKEMMDILVRLRTGAAISEQEEKFYKEQLPTLLDNESTIKSKLRRFEELFNSIAPERLEAQSGLQEIDPDVTGGSEGTNPKASFKSFNEYAQNTGNGHVMTGSKFHKGGEVDIDGKIGDPIPAFESGKVIAVKDSGNTGYGKHVIIQNSQGEQIIYGHLSGFNVKVGQTVQGGYAIGKMGNSGNVIAGKGGDGSHLHIEKRDGSGRVIALATNKSYA